MELSGTMKRKALQGKWKREASLKRTATKVYRKKKPKATYATVEKKFFDTDVDDATIGSMMTINNLCIIPEGVGESERVGRKLRICNIYWKYSITLKTTATAANTSDIVKVMLVHDKQTNGEEFTALDLLDLDAWESFRNLANASRFQVLMSQDIAMNTQSGSGRGTTDTLSYGEAVQFITGGKEVSIPIEYDNSANTGVITTIRTNNLYWVTQSTAAICTGLGTVRLRYTDR